MKRYNRTKDGKIFDTEPFNCIVQDKYYKTHKNRYITNQLHIGNDIEKQADTIEGLIMVGDLVKSNGIVIEVDKWVLKRIQHKGLEITELYTKQGNDYILVARKENGEWIVL